MQTAVLKIRGLGKNYGPIKALQNFDLDVKAGQILGILGPNGSGKSTLLGMVLGAIIPHSGTFEWFGEGGNMPGNRVGSLLETPSFYPGRNAIDNLKIVGHIKRSPDDDYDELLRMVNLYERRKSPFKSYSLGMKQRLGIAATMVGNPDVLVLDEPTNGLDPVGIAEIRNLILDLASRGKTIIMASHILDEVEKVCTHVAILKKGKLMKTGPVGALLSPTKRIELISGNPLLMDILKIYSGVSGIELNGKLHSFTADLDFDLEQLCDYIATQGVVLTGIKETKVSLEEEFLQITKEG
jgi:ABC-2 type transport system ATP-binding protein